MKISSLGILAMLCGSIGPSYGQTAPTIIPPPASTPVDVATTGKSNSIIYVDGAHCSSIALALASCPPTGCIVIDESQGTVSTSINPFAGITAPFIVYLGPATYQTTAQWQLTYSNQMVIGRGINATNIIPVAGFPINISGGKECTVQIGMTGNNYVDNTRLEELTVHGLLTDQFSCALYSADLNEGSGVRDLGLVNFNQYGIHFKGANTGDFMIEHINGNPSPNASKSVMVFLDHTGDKSFVTDITCGSGSGSQQSACIDFSYGQSFAQEVHCENFVDCVRFDPGSWGAAINVVGLEANSVTNAIHIMSGTGAVFVASASNGTGNTLLNNATGFITANGDIIASYSFSGSSTGGECFLTQRSNGSQCTGPIKAKAYATSPDCSTPWSPAACGSAAAGSVSVRAGATTEVVNTSAVTANSQIFVTFDSSLGAKLGVTCNTTAESPTISARHPDTSFTISVPDAPISNPACYSYLIVN
jgi:hypothetical protein